MKKTINYIIVFITFFLLIMPVACAANLSKKYVVCHDTNVLTGLRVLGYIVLIAKILVPVVLIITAMYSFFKAVVSSDENEIKNATTLLVSRLIVGVIVFFIPSIVTAIFDLVDSADISGSSYSSCVKCITSIKQCNSYIDTYKNGSGN